MNTEVSIVVRALLHTTLWYCGAWFRMWYCGACFRMWYLVPVSEDMKSPLADTALPTHLIRIIRHNTGVAAEETEGGEECAKMASDLLLSLLVGGK